MTLGERLAAVERDVKNVRETDLPLVRGDIATMDAKLDKTLAAMNEEKGRRTIRQTIVTAITAVVSASIGGIITKVFHGP